MLKTMIVVVTDDPQVAIDIKDLLMPFEGDPLFELFEIYQKMEGGEWNMVMHFKMPDVRLSDNLEVPDEGKDRTD
jgi:hypothetical protein